MEVAHWLHTGNSGGLEKFVFNLSEELKSKGIHSEIYFTKPSNNYPHHSFYKLLKKIKSGKRFLFHYTGNTMLHAIWLNFFNSDLVQNRIYMHSFSNKMDLYHKISYSFFEKFIFPTKISLALSDERLPIIKEKKIFQYFGVPHKFSPETKSLNSQRIIFTSMSLVDKDKRILELVELINYTLKMYPDLKKKCEFKIFGAGNSRDKNNHYFNQCLEKSRESKENIFIKGHTQCPEEEIQKSDYLFFTSKNEFYGFSLLEAFQQGVPALTANSGSFLELNSDRTGFFLDFLDFDKSADIIYQAVHIEKNTYQNFSANCKKIAKEKFNISNTTDEFIQHLGL